MKEYVKIGFVLKPQGVRGEIKVEPLTDNPDRFYDLDKVMCQGKQIKQSYIVESCAVRMGSVYLKLQGIHDRTAAEALRGSYLCVSKEHAIELPEGHHFIFDLIGCEIIDTMGQRLGILKEILQNGAADVYVIKGERGCLLPALRRLIVSEDIESKQIIVDATVLSEVAVWDED